ncbi:NAD kinase [Oceanobacillus piezotolerans]|uniref:NAD kinase n=1 Tax=Oceanobacillus piezotolerans TaxID=2448030 RepID=A0A498DF66_9BACI|nr:NAD kinase [Oceanobacillus piezotolerans]RLL47848.1 NAD kinase [Oceanobacillus piezotolerans]
MDRKNMYFYYQKDEDTEQKLQAVFALAKENGFQIVDDHRKATIIISVGGDGMFLQAVRETGFRQNAIYAGIISNEASSYYCDFNLDNFDELFHTVLNEELEVRRFPVIKVKVNNGNSNYCLNEVTVRSTIVKTIVIDVYIDDLHFETFRGDGIVVSTPTGSTGYNKSTTGAVIDPLLPCFQVSEIASMNNNNYRTLGSSFILSKDHVVRFIEREDGNDHPIVSFDNEAFPIRKIQEIEISMDETVIKTVKLKNNTSWHRVKRMFLS